MPICNASNLFTRSLNACQSLVLLGIRLYLANVFLWSGWLKLTDWSSTLYLFANEYKVPIISPVLAAYTGTAAELILPILLLLGLGGRIFAFAFFIFNLVMVYSYPILLTPEGACFVKDNVLWGTLIGVLLFFGVGKYSLDYLLQKKVCKDYQY
jgi:putative oxidoreductase